MLQFKDKIKKLRKEKDMTQEQLAEYMGVSPQAVSRWETGSTYPDIFALPLLAELFGITVDGLLGVDEKEKQKDIVFKDSSCFDREFKTFIEQNFLIREWYIFERNHLRKNAITWCIENGLPYS